jgi:hypothetical protein
MARSRSAARRNRRSGAIASSGGSSNRVVKPGVAEAQEDREAIRSVHDGRLQLGAVYGSVEGFEAVLSSGRSLGVFRSAAIAASAISAAEREASCD